MARTAGPNALSTSAVAAMTGYAPQQIRDLEALGTIAPARRADNGYRQFSETHVRELRTYRQLAHALGPVRARQVLREIRSLPVDQAAALVSAQHARLSRERDEALAAQRALRAIRAEAATEAAADAQDAMTISQLADAIGVRASTLRFWEKAGLVRPDRVRTRAGSARRYPLPAIREARITAALRAAGYRIPDVHRTIASLRDVPDVEQPLGALQARVDAIAARMLALLRAGTTLAGIIASDPPHGEAGSAVARDAARAARSSR